MIRFPDVGSKKAFGREFVLFPRDQAYEGLDGN